MANYSPNYSQPRKRMSDKGENVELVQPHIHLQRNAIKTKTFQIYKIHVTSCLLDLSHSLLPSLACPSSLMGCCVFYPQQ